MCMGVTATYLLICFFTDSSDVDIYQQSQGNGNWSDFMELVSVLHSNLTGPAFVQALSDCFDVDKYVNTYYKQPRGK